MAKAVLAEKNTAENQVALYIAEKQLFLFMADSKMDESKMAESQLAEF